MWREGLSLFKWMFLFVICLAGRAMKIGMGFAVPVVLRHACNTAAYEGLARWYIFTFCNASHNGFNRLIHGQLEVKPMFFKVADYCPGIFSG